MADLQRRVGVTFSMARNMPAQWGCRKGPLAELEAGKFTSDCELNLCTAKTWVLFAITPFHKLTAKGRLCTFLF